MVWKEPERVSEVVQSSGRDAVVWSAGQDETPETHTPVRSLRVHTAAVNAVQRVFIFTLIHIDACHGGDVQLISVITVTCVTFLNSDTAAILTATDNPTLF